MTQSNCLCGPSYASASGQIMFLARLRSIDFFATLVHRPEWIFRKQLENCPTHPFIEVQHEVYVRRFRSPSFRPLLIFLIVDLVSFWFTYSLPPQDKHAYIKTINVYMLIPALVLLCLVPAVWRHRLMRTYVIDASRGIYEFYIGNALVYRGRLRNIYVRVKGTGTGGETYCCLIVNGFQLEELCITGYTTNLTKLRTLGRRLALRLNINYFDVHDLSSHHVILHRSDNDGTSRELASIGVSSLGRRISPV